MSARPEDSPRRQLIAIGIFALVYLMMGMAIPSSYYQLMMTLVLIWAAMGLSWNVLSGYSGLIRLARRRFLALVVTP